MPNPFSKLFNSWIAQALVAAILLSLPAQAGTQLDLNSYLAQVKRDHPGVRSALVGSDASLERADEGQLLLAYNVYLDTSYKRDAKLNAPLFLLYDAQEFTHLNLGVSKLFQFGLQAKLYYDISTFNYVNPSLSPTLANMFGNGNGGSTSGGGAFPLSIANAATVLELTQSLWSNGFGRGTQANLELHQAQALASSYGSRFQAKSELSAAESRYWRLAAARQLVRIQQEALDRAQRIYDWNLRRSKLHLGESSDLLQSEALVQSRKLELASAKNEERASSRAFNLFRNLDSDQVSEELLPLDPQLITDLDLQPPKRADFRDDVLAAREAARAGSASATLALERDLPTLEAYGTVALNGQQGNTIFSNLSDAIPSSFSLNRPTAIVGIRFSSPIDFSLVNTVRNGWKKEAIAAELKYDQKVMEQEQGWKNLNETFQEAKHTLELALNLEKIQKSKLANERDRLQHGRTTTYQVLLFEQDYLLAELNRIRSQAQVLELIAQMKLFGDHL